MSEILRTPAGRAALLLAVALLVRAPLAEAQTVTGQVVAEDGGEPLSGAMVVLLDASSSREVARTLTDGVGRFSLNPGTPGRYSVRVDRIGHISSVAGPFELEAGATVERRIEAPLNPVLLSGINVEAERRCVLEPEEGEALARVWGEARKALERTAWTRREGLLAYEVETYERTLDPMARRVEDETSQTESFVGESPFESAPAASLTGRGFVQERPSGMFYYAPDADALLSDEFRSTHCFRLAESEEDEDRRLGIGFEPVEGREIADIEGVIWLDPETSRLESLEFRYVNLSREVDTRRLGGYVEYQGLPGGTWMVPRWWIRMPIVGVREEGGGFFNKPRRELAGIREVGAEVKEVSGGEAPPAERARGSVVGMVYDSTRARPLSGAVVSLEGTEHTAETNGLGLFRLEGLRPGTFRISFRHPRLDTLGVELAADEVTVEREGRSRVRLFVPSWVSILLAGCEEPPDDSTAAVVGFVRDRLTGAPVSGALVKGGESSDPAGGPEAVTDARGRYRLCRLPAGEALSLEAEYLGRTSGPVEVSPAAGQPVFRELALPLSEPIRVLGRVLNAATGVPLPEAMVRVDTLARVSDDQGRFVIPDLAPGLYPVEVRHIAYGTLQDTVLIRGSGDVHLELALRSVDGPAPGEALEIEGIEVTVRSSREEALRRRGTRFDGMLPAQVDSVRDRVTTMEDLLREARIPGLRVAERQILGEGGMLMSVLCLEGPRAGARAREGAGGCAMPEVYIDGARIHQPGQLLRVMDPSVVWAFEFVPPLEARLTYGVGAEHGALLIETVGGR